MFNTAFPHKEREAARFVYKPRASESRVSVLIAGHLAFKPMHVPVNLTLDLAADLLASLCL